MNYWLYYIGKFILYFICMNVILNIIDMISKKEVDNDWFIPINSILFSISLLMIEIGVSI